MGLELYLLNFALQHLNGAVGAFESAEGRTMLAALVEIEVLGIPA